jgi:hypothetical protein
VDNVAAAAAVQAAGQELAAGKPRSISTTKENYNG